MIRTMEIDKVEEKIEIESEIEEEEEISLTTSSEALPLEAVNAQLERLISATEKISRSISAPPTTGRLTEAEEDRLLVEGDAFGTHDYITKQPECVVNGVLRPFQIEGVNWLYQLYRINANGLLADEMGLGKTVQIISFLGHLKSIGSTTGPHLIVVPRSTLENWVKELHHWCPILKVIWLWGTKDERDAIFHKMRDHRMDVCVTTFEVVLREKGRLLSHHFNWNYVIIDEAHRIKNEKSVLAQIVRCFATSRRVLVTGTPLQNNLRELWALLNFLTPKLFEDAVQFEQLFNISHLGLTERDRVIKALHTILKPLMLRRLKSEVAGELPPKHELYVFTGMSTLQKKIYSDLLSKNIDFLNSVTVKLSKYNLLNILMQLRKCCNHPYLFDGVEKKDPITNQYVIGQHLVEVSGKMVLLDKLLPKLKAQGSRLLIFSQMTRMLDILDDYCNWKGYQCCRIDGSTPGIERQEQIDRFNNNDSKFIFLLSTRAGGVGINLATADVVILYDSDFNPQLDLQAMDRAHRIGQKKSVRVFRFVTETSVEERIVERAAKRLKLDALLIQGAVARGRGSDPPTEEFQKMLRHGAQEVYSTQNMSSISDLDADTILRLAETKSKEIQESLDTLEQKFNLNDLDIESIRLFEESTLPSNANELSFIGSEYGMFLDMGDRKNKWRPVEKPSAPRKTLTGWRAEANGGYDFQFFNATRLDELEKIKQKAKEDFIKKEKEKGKKVRPFTPQMEAEKCKLLKEGFRHWNQSDFIRLTKALREIPVSDYVELGIRVGKTPKEIEEYLDVLLCRHKEIKSVSGFANKVNRLIADRCRRYYQQKLVVESIRRKLDGERVRILKRSDSLAGSRQNNQHECQREENELTAELMKQKVSLDEQLTGERKRKRSNDSVKIESRLKKLKPLINQQEDYSATEKHSSNMKIIQRKQREDTTLINTPSKRARMLEQRCGIQSDNGKTPDRPSVKQKGKRQKGQDKTFEEDFPRKTISMNRDVSEDKALALPLMWNTDNNPVDLDKMKIGIALPKGALDSSQTDERLLFGMSCFGTEQPDMVSRFSRCSATNDQFFISHQHTSQALETRQRQLIDAILNMHNRSIREPPKALPLFR